jgi:betaine lipid synthase
MVPLSLIILATYPVLREPLRFAYNCFLKPFLHTASSDQRDSLDRFYSGQADVYDTTRAHLLKGRETMLQLLASHLKAQSVRGNRPKIWVDIGGGTGWNIEKM